MWLIFCVIFTSSNWKPPRLRTPNNDPLDFIVGKDEWEGEMEKSEVPRICEDHFTLDSFETTEDEEAHKVLMPDAIPTLKLKVEKI